MRKMHSEHNIRDIGQRLLSLRGVIERCRHVVYANDHGHAIIYHMAVGAVYATPRHIVTQDTAVVSVWCW